MGFGCNARLCEMRYLQELHTGTCNVSKYASFACLLVMQHLVCDEFGHSSLVLVVADGDMHAWSLPPLSWWLLCANLKGHAV